MNSREILWKIIDGTSVAKLADKSGVSKTTIRRTLNGESDMTAGNLIACVQAAGYYLKLSKS